MTTTEVIWGIKWYDKRGMKVREERGRCKKITISELEDSLLHSAGFIEQDIGSTAAKTQMDEATGKHIQASGKTGKLGKSTS